jgi:uncharacterized protein YukE
VDGDWVRGYAGEVGELAGQVHAVAAALAMAGATGWRSTAAEEFRRALDEQRQSLGGVVTALDEARAALEVHARAVDDVLSGPLGALAAGAAALVEGHL